MSTGLVVKAVDTYYQHSILKKKLHTTNSNGSHKIKSRAFKNVDFPVDYEYKSSKNAWLQNFVEQVRSFLKTQNLDENALLQMHMSLSRRRKN
jgi:hypothetical protein